MRSCSKIRASRNKGHNQRQKCDISWVIGDRNDELSWIPPCWSV